MRIAITTLSEDPKRPTGSLDFFQQTIAGLVARDPGNEYFIFVSKANRHLFDSPVPNKTLIEAGSSNERRVRRILSEQFLIPWLLRRHRIDVFFTSSGGGVAPIWIPQRTKLVLAVYATQHLSGGLRLGFFRSIYRRWMAIPSLKRAERVIVNSQACLTEIRTQIDVRRKAAIIYHGIDSRRYHDGPLDPGERSGFERHGLRKPFILFLSTIYFYKNVHGLVEAFGKLVTSTALPHELALVGRLDSYRPDGGDYAELLRKIARQHGVEDRVRFIGAVAAEDLRALYKLADVYVQPSFYETFGKTVIEAFCCGCPVIGANTAATPEIIGDAGLVFDPHKPDQIAQCLRRVLTEPGLRDALIAKGRQRAGLFAVEHEVAWFIDVFNEAGGAGRSHAPASQQIPDRDQRGQLGMKPVKPYRLLQVFSRYVEAGGEETTVNRIADVLSCENGKNQCWFDNRDWVGPAAPMWMKQAMLMIRNPSALCALRERHNALRPDAWMVHNVFPVGSAGVFREALQRGVPIIYYIHNFRPFSVNGYLWAGDGIAEGGLRRNYWQEIRHGAWQNSIIKTAWFAFVLTLTVRLGWFKSVKAWVAVSDFMRDKFIEAGVPAEDIFTVRHAWWPMPDPPPPQDGGYYLFLGRLVPAKGIRVLFDAWKIVRDELGDRAPKLIIAGAGPSESWVREKVRENPLVEFRGSVSGDEKHQLLAACRAVIAPSVWWEPNSLVTYEAYDYSKPILASRSGGRTETVEVGKTGILHEPGNADELARHVIELDAAPGRRAEMGRSGRAWLIENTNEDDWRRKIEKVVEHALRGT